MIISTDIIDVVSDPDHNEVVVEVTGMALYDLIDLDSQMALDYPVQSVEIYPHEGSTFRIYHIAPGALIRQ